MENFWYLDAIGKALLLQDMVPLPVSDKALVLVVDMSRQSLALDMDRKIPR